MFKGEAPSSALRSFEYASDGIGRGEEIRICSSSAVAVVLCIEASFVHDSSSQRHALNTLPLDELYRNQDTNGAPESQSCSSPVSYRRVAATHNSSRKNRSCRIYEPLITHPESFEHYHSTTHLI